VSSSNLIIKSTLFWRIFTSSNNLSQFDEDNSCGLVVDALVMLMFSSPPYYKACKTLKPLFHNKTKTAVKFNMLKIENNMLKP